VDAVFKKENIQFHLAIEENLPQLEMDYDRITQVVLNLLSNAQKHCDKSDPEVWLKATVVGSQLEVTVEDNGLGVKEELQEIIFEKFFQAKNQTMRKPKGSGLGLAISKKIIQLHEGKISVMNRTPKGSVFTFSLPIQKYRY